MLHIIFHRHGLTPDEVYNKPKRSREFLFASVLLELEREEAERVREERKRVLKEKQQGG